MNEHILIILCACSPVVHDDEEDGDDFMPDANADEEPEDDFDEELVEEEESPEQKTRQPNKTKHWTEIHRFSMWTMLFNLAVM